MTIDEIKKLPDDELARLVAEKVMGWTSLCCESAYFPSWSDSDGCGQGPVSQWKPLKDWNATHMVIDAMREKGWRYAVGEYALNFYTHKFIKRGFGGECVTSSSAKTEKRAILEAALAAIEAKPEEVTG